LQSRLAPGINVRPYLIDNPKAKRAGGMAQVVECLPSKHKTLNFNSNTTKKKRKKNNKKRKCKNCTVNVEYKCKVSSYFGTDQELCPQLKLRWDLNCISVVGKMHFATLGKETNSHSSGEKTSLTCSLTLLQKMPSAKTAAIGGPR
jgi:hypothetical protein